MNEFLVRAFIWSGRPDPEWYIDGTIYLKIKEIWGRLEECTIREMPYSLGYRGIKIFKSENDIWYIYNSYVSESTDDWTLAKNDPDMSIEKILFESAPEDLNLPSLT